MRVTGETPVPLWRLRRLVWRQGRDGFAFSSMIGGGGEGDGFGCASVRLGIGGEGGEGADETGGEWAGAFEDVAAYGGG